MLFFFQIKSTINQEPLRFLRELSGQQIKGEMLRNDVSVTVKTLSLVCVWKTLDGWHEAWPDNSRVNGSQKSKALFFFVLVWIQTTNSSPEHLTQNSCLI